MIPEGFKDTPKDSERCRTIPKVFQRFWMILGDSQRFLVILMILVGFILKYFERFRAIQKDSQRFLMILMYLEGFKEISKDYARFLKDSQ